MTFDRPPREVYIRVSRARNSGGQIDLGLEYRDGDPEFDTRQILRTILREEDDLSPNAHAKSAAEAVELRMKRIWPDRAYFIESWYGVNDNEWLQIFQPFGVPKNG